MKLGGTYRIDEYEFPAPLATWEDQVIGPGLDGMPFLCSYMLHKWEWPSGALEAEFVDKLMEKFKSQQSTGAQLDELETDPYDASLWDEQYGTHVYTDFTVLSVAPVKRSLPHYDGISVVFEVYVG